MKIPIIENTELLDTKEKILNATLQVISKYGYENVTMRKIAKFAGINSALVNYHFGSKDNVLNEALKYMTFKLQHAFSHLREEENTPEERLRNFFIEYASIELQHPAMIKNFIFQTINKSSIFIYYEEYLKTDGMNLLLECLLDVNPDADVCWLKKRIFQSMAALSAPVLIASKMESIVGINFRDADERSGYIDILLESLLRDVSLNR